MSGLGAPLRAATPAAERAMLARPAAKSLPDLTRSSVAAVVRRATSIGVPFSIAAFNSAAAPKVVESLLPLACSNCGVSCSRVDFRAFDARSLISAASAVPAPVMVGTVRPAAMAMAAMNRMASSALMSDEFADREIARPLSANRRNGEELLGLEAGAADERTVDVLSRHQRAGIGRLDRAAIEDACPLPGCAIAGVEALAHEAMHLHNVTLRRGEARADRPDRLIGDDNAAGIAARG